MEERNGKFRDSIWINNKKITSPTFARKCDAKAWKANMLSKRTKQLVLGEDYKEPSELTFKEFAEEWLSSNIKTTKAPNTFKEYERIIRIHLCPIVGEVKLRDIRMAHAEKIMTALIKRGIGSKGSRDVIILLKQVMNEAERREEINRNYVSHFKAPKVQPRDITFWQEDELKKFFSVCISTPYFPFFVSAFYTGMRKGELGGLTWDCVNFDNKIITVKSTRDRHGHRPRTKSGRIRHYGMNPFLSECLYQVFLKRCSDNDYVFTIKNKPIDVQHINRVFDKLQLEAGITNRLRMHDSRHTFASHFVMRNFGSLYDLSKILGHSDLKTTQIYAHLSSEHIASKTQEMKYCLDSEVSKSFTPILPRPSENVLILENDIVM